MEYGGIGFEHVWKFQLKTMLGGQYKRCITATNQEDIIVACLRLGWNDAFRHTSRNVGKIDEKEKENIIIGICKQITSDFSEYAKLTSTKNRHDYINKCLENNEFKQAFGRIKVIAEREEKTLCFGHIQKIFNMALKLFLCLKICAEQAASMDLNIGLNADLFECDFAFESADCPIDSKILGKLGEKNQSKWSKLGQDSKNPTSSYINAQKAIAEQLGGTNKSNLCYDFENWND